MAGDLDDDLPSGVGEDESVGARPSPPPPSPVARDVAPSTSRDVVGSTPPPPPQEKPASVYPPREPREPRESRERDYRDGDREPHEEPERKRLFERAIPEILKRVVERAVESGAHRVAEAPENLRNFVNDLKLPKEVIHYLYNQVDETKNGLYRVAAKEIRDVLEQTQFADELTKVLTKLSFEIKTEIRFIPNDQAVGKKGEEDESGATKSGLPKPEVKAQVAIKNRDKKREDT